MNNYQVIEYADKCLKMDFRLSLKDVITRAKVNVNKNKLDREPINLKRTTITAISSIIGLKDIDKILCLSKMYSVKQYHYSIILNNREKEYCQRMIDFIYRQANKFAMNDFENFI